LAIAQKIKDDYLICLGLSDIGINYTNMGKYNDALEYSLKAYKIASALNNKYRMASELDNEADIFLAQKQYDKAISYLQKAKQIVAAFRNEYYTAFLNISLGNILYEKGQYPAAMGYYQESLAYYTRTNDQLGRTKANLQIAKVYFKNKDYSLASKYALESLTIAENKKNKKRAAAAAQMLADTYEAQGDAKNALQYLKIAKNYNDSLFNNDTQRKLFQLQAQYKYEQEAAALKEEQTKKDIQNANTLQNQKQQIIIAVLIILALGAIVIGLYQSRADKLKINQVLQEKNVEISRQKEEIEKQAAKLRISNGQKDKLFSVIAHDLRSPFISLQSLLTLFKEEALPIEKVKEIIETLNVNVDHTVSLVTNLLYWASSQMNGAVVNAVSFQLSELIDKELGFIQKAVVEKGIVLAGSKGLDINVFADKDMISSVVRNLLSNAVKFCNTGGTITVTATKKDNNVEVCIADTGNGIKQEVLQKINNGESVTTFGTAKEKGTGLGLLLCKDFIDRNNGSFRIESEVGKGSRFYFTLTIV
jgi:signal transduction histidine kinase